MHGSTPAAWTAITICLIGFTVGAIALMLSPNWPVFWVGLAIVVVSPLVGKVMSAAGLGAKVPH